MSDVNMEQMPDLGRFVDYVWSLKAERDQLRAEVAMLRSYEAEWEHVLSELRAELAAIRGRQCAT